MSILWAGGEDIDFPNGAALQISTNVATFRTSFARCSLGYNDTPGALAKSTQLSGGAVTSAWLSYTASITTSGTSNLVSVIGLGNSGTGSWIGTGMEGPNSVPTLVSVSSGICTTLAIGTAYGNVPNGVITRYDLQIINYGTSGTMNLYINGAFAVSYSGNISIPGTSNLDCVCIENTSRFYNTNISEIMVSDIDTRNLIGLVTCAPNGNGTVQDWSNPAYTNFNPITINDTNSTYTNLTGKDEQVTMINTPLGSYQIDSVKIAARALTTTGAVATKIEFGFHNTNNSVTAVGSPHSLTTAFETVEEYLTIDPTTGTGFPPNFTGYQFDMRSA